MHLLYVDDDRINVMLFEAACASLPGVTVASAASGAEALALAAEARPDLLVIDLHLPDTDGHALLAELRATLPVPPVPAFLCSADDGAELRSAAAEAGFAGCWTKPVDRGLLQREFAALGLLAP